MATVTGRAVIYGFPGTEGTGLAGIATFINDSGDISSDIKIDEIRNEANDLVGLVHSGEVFTASMMFTPATTAPGTLTALKALLVAPTIGAAVTLTLFDSPEMNKTDWVYAGGWKLSFKKDGIATYELKLMRSNAGNIAAAVGA